jgi:hypothetical protein
LRRGLQRYRAQRGGTNNRLEEGPPVHGALLTKETGSDGTSTSPLA